MISKLVNRLFHSLNVRLSIIILAISFAAYSLLRVVSRLTYTYSLYPGQIEANRLQQSFVNHPDYEKAIALMPVDLAELFASVHAGSSNTIMWFDGLVSTFYIVVLGIFLFLGPILVVLVVIINNYVTAPMQKLTAATRHLAKGNFAARTELNTRYWDRYSVALANNFNGMASSLERLENERTSMISDIAHELRTPITAMQLQLEAVQDGIDPLDMHLINALYGETELLSSLIVDLRTLSLAEARQLTLNQQAFNLYDLVHKTMNRFQASAQKKNIKLAINGAEDTHLYADAERINQVLNNLMSNAIRHTPIGGKVTAEFVDNGEELRLSIINTGSALPEKELAQIFNRFYRSGQGQVRAEGGSGLGLAIVKALTELHGGSISAENYGKDSIAFSLSLPQAAA